MYCPNCGEQVSDTAKFCRKCGQNLKVQAENIDNSDRPSSADNKVMEINRSINTESVVAASKPDNATRCFLKFYAQILPIVYAAENVAKIFCHTDDPIAIYKDLHDFVDSSIYLASKKITSMPDSHAIGKVEAVHVGLHELLTTANNILLSFKEVDEFINSNKKSEDSIWNSDVSAGSGTKKKLLMYGTIGIGALMNPAVALGAAIAAKSKISKQNNLKSNFTLSYKNKEYDNLCKILQSDFNSMLVRVFNKKKELFLGMYDHKEELTIVEKINLKVSMPYLPDVLVNCIEKCTN